MIPDNFRGAALPRSATIYAEIAETIGCESEVIRAVVAVEAGGRGFLKDGRPAILYEEHIFHRLTGGRYDALAPEISNPEPGGYQGGAAEYGRLAIARDLDPDAALRSCSWGLGQIMGFNCNVAGFETVDAFVGSMCQGEDNQLWAFAAFIKAAGLADELRRKDWVKFARGYNGPGYARNNYDAKLIAAYAKALALVRDPIGRAPVVSARQDIAELQSLLALAGYWVRIDGWDGPETRAAVLQFQTDHGLQADGIVGPITRAALRAELPIPSRPPA